MITRRELLASVALLSGGAVLPLACALPAKRKKGDISFYYSLNTSTISGAASGIISYIDIAAEAGYDYIEIWVRDIEAYLEAGNSLASLDSHIKDHGIKPVSAIGFAPWMTGGRNGFDQMRKEMEMLASIGCPRIAAPPAGIEKGVQLDLFEVGEKYAMLLELGRETGVMPQLEFWGASHALWHMGQLLMIVAVAGDPDARILPDIYHLFRGGSDFDSLKMIDGSLIDLFHMNDYLGDKPRLEQTDADRVYPGDGAAPVKEVLSDLYNMGGDKILSLELFNRSYWQQDPLEVAKTGLEKMKSAVSDAIKK